MKRKINLRVLCAPVILTLVLGCGQIKNDRSESAMIRIEQGADAIETREKLDVSKDELEEATIDVNDINAPEGVVNLFFHKFFSGDDDAFQFLTSKAQKAKKGTFLAQESDCVSWRIIGKTKPKNGRVKVLVELEDYDGVGEIQTDRLTFLLTDDDSKWRIARFGIGELEVDFEEQTASGSPVARTSKTLVNEPR